MIRQIPAPCPRRIASNTKTSPRLLPQQDRDTPETWPGHHQAETQTSPNQNRNRTVPKYTQTKTETRPRQHQRVTNHWDLTETSPKQHYKTPPWQDRHKFAETTARHENVLCRCLASKRDLVSDTLHVWALSKGPCLVMYFFPLLFSARPCARNLPPCGHGKFQQQCGADGGELSPLGLAWLKTVFNNLPFNYL